MSAVSLIGSTIPLVPRMDIPPSIPRRGLNVFLAISTPSGTDITVLSPPVYPNDDDTSSRASLIMDRGTRFIAALPGGWSSPLRVTLPTPIPPSISIPCGILETSAYTFVPCVASMSSPPSFLTAQDALPSSMRRSSTGRSSVMPLGVAMTTLDTGSPRSAMAAALDAAAAQVPVVCPHLMRLLLTKAYISSWVPGHIAISSMLDR